MLRQWHRIIRCLYLISSFEPVVAGHDELVSLVYVIHELLPLIGDFLRESLDLIHLTVGLGDHLLSFLVQVQGALIRRLQEEMEISTRLSKCRVKPIELLYQNSMLYACTCSSIEPILWVIIKRMNQSHSTVE